MMEVRNLLPIKEKSGRWIFPTAVVKQDDENNIIEDEQSSEDQENFFEKTSINQSFMQQYVNEQKKLKQVKNKIAMLCNSVVEDPENNMPLLKELIVMFEKPHTRMIVTEKKLLALSLLHVFTDILPGYKIRTNQETETKIKLKKETKRMLNYELSLLRYYKKYLDCLHNMINDMKCKRNKNNISPIKKKALRAVGVVAVKCMCELLPERYYFNYSKTIISIIIPLIANKKSLVSDMCSKAIQKLYKADKLGEASLEAVKQTAKVIKERNFCVPEILVKTFLYLNLQEIKENVQSKKADMKKVRKQLNMMSRKEKKHKKKMRELELQLREAEAQESKENKSKLQTEILKKIFWVYFHILKDDSKSSLITVALEGLSKFAHLINLEFFDDLSSVLYDLMENKSLNDGEKLHCMHTVFVILSGQAASLNIDPQNLYNHLYKILLNTQNNTPCEEFEIILKCIELMILKRKKKITINRILAFVKRLCTTALQTPPHFTLAILCVVRTIMLNINNCDILLDTENSVGSGIYLPELENPEHCNPCSTSLWELNLLKKHYNPTISSYACHILHGCPIQGRMHLPEQLGKLTPEDIFKHFTNIIMNCEFNVKKRNNIAKKTPMNIQNITDKITSLSKNDVANIEFF